MATMIALMPRTNIIVRPPRGKQHAARYSGNVRMVIASRMIGNVIVKRTALMAAMKKIAVS